MRFTSMILVVLSLFVLRAPLAGAYPTGLTIPHCCVHNGNSTRNSTNSTHVPVYLKPALRPIQIAALEDVRTADTPTHQSTGTSPNIWAPIIAVFIAITAVAIFLRMRRIRTLPRLSPGTADLGKGFVRSYNQFPFPPRQPVALEMIDRRAPVSERREDVLVVEAPEQELQDLDSNFVIGDDDEDDVEEAGAKV
ncbi:hypothetical protein BDV95DRAFT_573881 [Massariosphaeria phaeospora]|uniref:Transmembrane protein n=1 Tax=Massariosphaeria phaeospora TaxID=100035 RepID=A0A7C8MMC6_9PLEO|nr:hypothetical protein BDV95DRAFT_573881 [Massariosphaeria phaeospora]